MSPICRDAPRYTSLGVHDDQLTPEEFFAHLTVEVSANWDFIVESRSRPRPSQLHPHATGDTADEVLGTRSADTIDVGDVSHAAAVDVLEGPQHDAQQQLCRKLDVSYAPLFHLRDLSSSPLDVIHRLAVAERMDGTAGDKYLNVEQFVHAHRSAYKSIRHHRAIDADKMLHNHMAKIVSIQDELSAVARQRDISTKRNEVETGARAATHAELRTIAPHEPYEDDPGDAIRIDISELGASPAEYARYLAVRHGIVNSEDQYNALILAVLPLEQLWRWAAEEGRLSDLNDPASALLLLQDAPPRFLGRLFCHGPGGSGKTFFITKVVQPTYARYLPGASVAFAAQNSAARLIGGNTMHKMAALTRQQGLSGTKPSAQAIEKCKHLWAHIALAIGDEGSQMDPELLATLSARAYYGRIQRNRWDTEALPDHSFGDVLMQVLLADFLQLNPVRTHTHCSRHS